MKHDLSISGWPCFGEYLEENYACDMSCPNTELCIKKMISGGGLAGLPEFLAHRNLKFRKVARKVARKLVEEA